ncbi:serine/threonine protein phosphatase 1 [Hoeflea halophila]|uniref:Serine/threonine protein phosphatase 1 n=1 Tax=Hoeflea halophila TaxID=714899 RepID=A0A286HMQ6_9HYPH|nr:metallophosphoesterase [Hoeflea halophila]SOE08444.1 serine/threonine protein phosphatase 1 [Hoeflea halophila]
MSLTYAIGDVHGRRDLLECLLAAIRADMGGRDGRIVFLGDIIDRGPESRQAMDLVIETLGEVDGSRLILGNHEEFMLAFLDAPTREDREAAARRWLPNGGTETLRSYGFADDDPLDRTASGLRARFPAHITALRDADWMLETTTHAFVHAGVDPDLPLARQDPETTRWIRERFLSFRGPLEKIVVHGHTMTASSLPELHRNRIALDTGAVRSGHLTCIVLDGDAPPRFLATDDHGPAVEVGEIRPLDCR